MAARDRDTIRELHGPFIMFHPIHRRVAGKLTTTVLLSFLLRQFSYHKRDKIFYGDSEIADETSLTPDELRAAKSELSELPFMQVTREGVRGKTHYEIDWRAFCRAVSDTGNSRNSFRYGKFPKQEASDTGNSRISLREKTNTENTTLSRAVGTTTATDKRFLRFATQLAEAIATVRKVNSTSKVKSWAKSFRLLHKMDGVEVARIKAALAWYCHRLPTHHGVKYFLDIQSGVAFREKFIKLESAIRRESVDHDNSPETDGAPSAASPIEEEIGQMSDEDYEKFMEENC